MFFSCFPSPRLVLQRKYDVSSAFLLAESSELSSNEFIKFEIIPSTPIQAKTPVTLERRCPWCLPNRWTRSAPRTGDFGAQWLACASPVNAARAISRPPAHDSGP